MEKQPANDTLATEAIGFRSSSASVSPPIRELLNGAEDVFRLTKDLVEAQTETFAAFLLDGRGRTIERKILSMGSATHVEADPATAFRAALLANASNVVFVHNHPSGSHEPSEDDMKATMRLVAAGGILGITVLDHIVVASEGYTSIREFMTRKALGDLEKMAKRLLPPDIFGDPEPAKSKGGAN